MALTWSETSRLSRGGSGGSTAGAVATAHAALFFPDWSTMSVCVYDIQCMRVCVYECMIA
jgi:hypothetical protein